MPEWCGEDSPFCGGDPVFCGEEGPWTPEDCSSTIDIALSNTGTDCDKIYSVHSTTNYNYPVAIYKRLTTSSCGGSVIGSWILVGSVFGIGDSLLLGGASFAVTEVKGIDSCGADSSSILSYANVCADCGGGSAIAGAESIASCGDTELYTWNGPSDSEDLSKPFWSVTGNVGTGGGISTNGLLTTGAGCCGTITICASFASCVVTKEVRMPDGFWEFQSTTASCGAGGTTCWEYNGGSATRYWYFCFPDNWVPPCADPNACYPGPSCATGACNSPSSWCVVKAQEFKWKCNP
jgi:hypothetical protein